MTGTYKVEEFYTAGELREIINKNELSAKFRIISITGINKGYKGIICYFS